MLFKVFAEDDTKKTRSKKTAGTIEIAYVRLYLLRNERAEQMRVGLCCNSSFLKAQFLVKMIRRERKPYV